MSDNLPALNGDNEPREIATTDTDSWISVIADVSRFAGFIAGTEFVPKSLRDNPAATTAAIIYGREVGLPPMAALTQTHVIEGRPSLSAEASRAKVIGAGHDIEVLESTGAICRMRARRRGTQNWTPEVVWTLDMARAANLLGKSNWKNNPRRMLQARASGELCHLYFPDVLLGFAVTEELLDEGGEEQTSPDAAAPTRVARKRVTGRKAPAALPAPAEPKERPADDGPPLPGEDGYDQAPSVALTEQTPAGGGSGDGTPSTHEGESGEYSRTTPADVDETVAPPTDDAPVVEELPDDAADVAPPAQDRPPAGPSSRAQHRMIFGTLERLGIDPANDGQRLAIVTVITGREIESFNNLSKADAGHVIETLARAKDEAQMWALLDEIEEARS